MKYRAEIDGLRALALIPVILYHAGFKLFGGGYVGVDIFFVISGYLITSIILSELDAGTFSLIEFYERRARRILPALFLVMFVCLPFAWFILLPTPLKLFSESLVAVSTFSSNILFSLRSGYFDSATELKPLIHTWSLAVEEQYYLLFPLFLMLTWKLGKRGIVGLLVIVFTFSLAGAQWLSIRSPSFAFYMLPTRGWEILIGAFIAFYYARTNIKSHNHNFAQLGGSLGLLLIAYSVFAYSDQTPFPSAYALVPTLGAALIIIFATHKTFVGKLLGSKLFVAIGLISYSAYLWHQPIFAFSRELSLDGLSIYLRGALALISFAVAYISWNYVERPFRNKHRINRNKVFVYWALCSFLFIGLGLAGYLGGGFKNRFPLFHNISSQGSDDLMKGNECFLLHTNVDAFNVDKCTVNTKKKYNVLLIGDSHAASLYGGLKDYLEEKNVNLGMLSAAFCLPLVEHFPTKNVYAATERCEKINQKINSVIQSNNYDLILVSSYILEWGFRNNPKTSYSSYYTDYVSKINTINSRNKVAVVGEFIIWTDGLPEVISKEIAHRNSLKIEDLPKYSSYGLDEKLFFTEKTLKHDLKNIGVEYISVIDGLCNSHDCMRYIETDNGGKLIAIDYGHLGIDGSQFISNKIIGPKVVELLKNKPHLNGSSAQK